MSNSSLFCLYFNFSYFLKSLTVTFQYFPAISSYIVMIFLDSAKLKQYKLDSSGALLHWEQGNFKKLSP